MKIRFKLHRRTNVYITIIACITAIAMLVVRFEYPVAEVWKILWVSLFFLVVIVALAAAIGFAYRWISERHDR